MGEDKDEERGPVPPAAATAAAAASSARGERNAGQHRHRHRHQVPPPRKRKRGEGRGEDDDNDDDDDYANDNDCEECIVQGGEGTHEKVDEEDDDDDDGAAPLYNGRKNARRVFANPYFYNGKNAVAALYKQEREVVIQAGATVRDVRIAYEGKDDGFAEFADGIGANHSVVKTYFARTSATVEQLLADEVLPVALNAAGELDVYRARGALSLDTLASTYQHGGRPGADGPGRSLPLAVVTGSSGSGKTFFCLKYLAGFFRREQDLAAVTLYVRPDPGVTEVGFDEEHPTGEVCKGLLEYIRRQIANKFGRQIMGRLRMHACVIFDEAGATDLCGRFEDKAFLEELCHYLQRHLADSVGVVVSGTGLTGANLTSAGDAFIFRLRPWEPNDVIALLEQRRDDLVLNDGDTVQDVGDAIFGHPKLRGLTTNARSAYFLREAILSLCSTHVADSWTVQLDAWAPALVTKVVHGYIEGNGIRGLAPDRRRVVAASVFRALEDAASFKPDSGDVVFRPPSFDCLDGKLLAMARSLVTWNVELIGASTGKGKVLQLVEGECRVISVTPAIATVLFVMAGVQVSMIRRWRAEEEVAALYAARQVILRCFDRFQASGDKKKLTEDLRKVRLHELRKQIHPFREAAATPNVVGLPAKNVVGVPAKKRQVRVPIVSPSSVLLNGDKASFADVIAPYMLLQAKHTSGKRVKINVRQELGKCCLLKRCEDNNQVLRGLLAVWDGTVADRFQAARGTARQDGRATVAQVHSPHALSHAYPENSVKHGDPVDVVDYAYIEHGTETMHVGKEEKLKLPLPNRQTIQFVISTNADVIDLVDIQIEVSPTLNVGADGGAVLRSEGDETETAVGGDASTRKTKSLAVTPDMLDPDLQLRAGSLGESQGRWDELRDDVVPGVTIKFLFTAAEAKPTALESESDPNEATEHKGVPVV